MSRAGFAIAALALGAGWCLWYVLSTRYASGDVYSEYSSQRTDQMGTRVLYEALGRTGVLVSRNDLPLDRAGLKDSTVLAIGFSPWLFSKENIAEIEGSARNGNRVVLALDPAVLVFDYSTVNKPLWEAWRVRLVRDRDEYRFETDPAAGWHGNTRAFGKGSVTLLGGSRAFTNGALKETRDLSTVEAAIGDARRVVFDETHLGTVQSGTVMGLVRQFRLQGVVAVGLICAMLFIWRSSAPFPPERPVTEEAQFRLTAASASEGVLNLLTVHIPPSRILQACVDEWKRDRGRLVSPETLARVESVTGQKTDPAAQWREIRAILDKKAK